MILDTLKETSKNVDGQKEKYVNVDKEGRITRNVVSETVPHQISDHVNLNTDDLNKGQSVYVSLIYHLLVCF